MRRWARTFGIFLMLSLVSVGIVLPQRAEASEITDWNDPPSPSELQAGYRANVLLAKFVPGTTTSLQNEVHSRQGGVKVDEIPEIGVQIVQVSGDVAQKVNAYRAEPSILYAEPDLIYNLASANDPMFPSQWELDRIRAVGAWDATSTQQGNAELVAVLDTGLFGEHEDLQGSSSTGQHGVWSSQNFLFSPPTTDVADDHGHGTLIAGLVAAATNNNIGMASIGGYPSTGGGAPVQVAPFKIANQNTPPDADTAAKAIAYVATRTPAGVINLSFAGTSYSQALQDAVRLAWQKNILTVAAAGNGTDNLARFPAAMQYVTAVGALDHSDIARSDSVSGDYMALSAPGTDITSTLLSGNYASSSLAGSSYSAALVSASAALYRFYRKAVDGVVPTVIQMYRALERASARLTSDWMPATGYGRLDLQNLISQTPRGGTGSIVGQMTWRSAAGNTLNDQSLQGAPMELWHGNALVGTATSLVGGRFFFRNLTPGIYAVKAKPLGFPNQVTDGVEVISASDSIVDVEIKGDASSWTSKGRDASGASYNRDDHFGPAAGIDSIVGTLACGWMPCTTFQMLRIGQKVIASSIFETAALTPYPGSALPIWRKTTQNWYGSFVPAVSSDKAFVLDATSSPPLIKALDLGNGTTLWSMTGATSMKGPILTNGLLVLTNSDRKVTAIDQQSGALRWQTTLPGTGSPQWAVADDQAVYVPDSSGRISILNPSNGVVTRQLDLSAVGYIRSISLSGERLIVQNPYAGVYVADKSSGSILATIPDATFLAVANGLIYGTNLVGELRAWRLDNGSTAWSVSSSDNYWSVSAANGIVYASTTEGSTPFDNYVEARDALTGSLLWRRLIYHQTCVFCAENSLWLSSSDGVVMTIDPSGNIHEIA